MAGGDYMGNASRKETPKWLTGQFDTIAVRVTNHPTVKKLCQQFR